MKKTLRFLLALTLATALVGGAFAGSAAAGDWYDDDNEAFAEADATAIAIGDDTETWSYTDADASTGPYWSASSSESAAYAESD